MERVVLARFNDLPLGLIGVVVNYLLTSLNPSSTLILSGDIGSGKTTLVRELTGRMVGRARVLSPSFNKMFIYQNSLCHIDCYNINGRIDNLLEHCEDLPTLVEWGERCMESLIELGRLIEVEVRYAGNRRSYTIARLVP